MTREPDQFQIQLADTTYEWLVCSKCTLPIKSDSDPEHVILWPAKDPVSSNVGLPWYLHISCYMDVIEGMVQFFKIFIKDKKKQRSIN